MKSLIFSASMMTALLDGRKTRTSRIIKFPKCEFEYQFYGMRDGFFMFGEKEYAEEGTFAVKCPLAVGDVFYAKETWCQPAYVKGLPSNHPGRTYPVLYAADEGLQRFPIGGNWVQRNKDFKWKSPLFMPEWAARFKGEITAVKAQRIREISAADAIREGIIINGEMMDPCDIASEAKDRFHDLWDSILGAGAWEKNEWVWAYDFRRVEEGK